MTRLMAVAVKRRVMTALGVAVLGAGVGLRVVPVVFAQQVTPLEHFKYGSIGIEENEGMPNGRGSSTTRRHPPTAIKAISGERDCLPRANARCSSI